MDSGLRGSAPGFLRELFRLLDLMDPNLSDGQDRIHHHALRDH